MPSRRIAIAIVVEHTVMDDNEDVNDVTVPYNSQWHVSLNKLIIHESLSVTDNRQNTVKKIVKEYLPTCPINSLEENILRKTCPFLKRTIYELIDEIEGNLEDPEIAERLEPTSFDTQLIECKNLLTRWEDILNHVAAQEEVKPSDIASLLEHFPGIVTKICLHCKEKRSSYPKRSLPLLFQDIYRDTCSNVKLFCGFIFKSLDFQNQEYLPLLKNLIKDLGEIASITIYFLTTMIQSWKTFGKLACDCYSFIKYDLEVHGLIISYFKNITRDIVWVYENMMKTSEDDSKGGKCMNLLLEILYRIHKSYVNDKEINSSSKHRWVREMVIFLIRLSGFYATKMYMKNKPTNSHAKAMFSHNWVDMFIKYYQSCEILHEELISRKEEMASADFECLVGYHIILLKSNLDVEEKVQIAFNNLNYLEEELMTSRVGISNLHTEKSEAVTASIYEYTLLSICDCLRGPKFQDLELFIFKNLLCEKFWPSLLSFDILQHLYRYSDGDLPFCHIKIFSEVYEQLHLRESTSMGVTLIGKLILSIYKSLSIGEKKEFHEICQSPATILLILKSPRITNSRGKLLIAYKKLIPVNSFDLSQTHQELLLQPSVKNWVNFVHLLTLTSIDKIDDDPDITSVLQKIFISILDTLNQVHDEFKQRIMFDLISILVNCTIVKKSTDMNAFNWNFLPVLAKEMVHTIKLPDIYLVEVCHFIQKNSKLLKIPPGQVEARVAMINLMCYLLSSSSPIVHQEALETFEYIVENGADDDFILKLGATITKKYNLLEVVPNYLKKRSVKKLSHEFIDINDYLTIFTENFDEFLNAHKCFIEETREREEKIPKIIPDFVDQQASKISDDLMDVINNKCNLSSNVVEKLTNACLKFIEK